MQKVFWTEQRNMNTAKSQFKKLLIYATTTVMQIVGEVGIGEVLVDDPEEIWNRTKEFSGVSKEFFDAYCSSDC